MRPMSGGSFRRPTRSHERRAVGSVGDADHRAPGRSRPAHAGRVRCSLGSAEGSPGWAALRSQLSAIRALCVPIAAWLPFCDGRGNSCWLSVVLQTELDTRYCDPEPGLTRWWRGGPQAVQDPRREARHRALGAQGRDHPGRRGAPAAAQPDHGRQVAEAVPRGRPGEPGTRRQRPDPRVETRDGARGAGRGPDHRPGRGLRGAPRVAKKGALYPRTRSSS